MLPTESVLPGDSYVAPFRLGPVFLVGIRIYYPKRNYIGVSREVEAALRTLDRQTSADSERKHKRTRGV